jgi:chaperonin cofactor prefoldin
MAEQIIENRKTNPGFDTSGTKAEKNNCISDANVAAIQNIQQKTQDIITFAHKSSDFLRQNNNNGNNEISLADQEMYQQIGGFCVKTKKEINELCDQFQKMKKFHEEQLKLGEVNYASGKSRVDALTNLDVLERSMNDARGAIEQVLNQIKQVQTLAKKATLGLGLGGASAEELDDDK